MKIMERKNSNTRSEVEGGALVACVSKRSQNIFMDGGEREWQRTRKSKEQQSYSRPIALRSDVCGFIRVSYMPVKTTLLLRASAANRK
jgi:hypothetical protein